jgi:iron(III) transport system substrate-binding protein
VRVTAKTLLSLAAALVVAVVAGCGGGAAPAAAPGAPSAPAGPKPTLVLYNAQHNDLAKAWVAAFTQATGIPVKVHQGGDFDLANQILAEGSASPADVFMTENSPALSLVSTKGALAPLDPATMTQVPAKYSSGAGDWVGIAARSTVVVYNPALVPADQLPRSILDLEQPQWKDKVGVAAGGADFQAIASAVFAVDGPDRARTWLAGLKQNARVYPNNVTILAAVNSGDLPAGVIYHYYWYKDRAESGDNSRNAELEFFANKDAGAFVSVSGAGVLKTSKHPQEAQQLVAFMSGKAGQQVLADTDALEYTVGDGVPASPKLKPFAELQPPDVDLNTLNGPQVVDEMRRAGLI